MMFLFATFSGVGGAFGVVIGEFIPALYDYGALGIIMGSMGLIVAIIFKLTTVDPTDISH